MKEGTGCGFFSWYPAFLQRFANTRTFIFIYGLLGVFQAMGTIYFIVTLQTVETRFKIPSQTTGIILSGNEISQILFSVILTYIGGKSNRPRFIAIGVYFCALSCFILALPHFIYGAGEDALKLTKEFVEASNITTIDNSVAIKMQRESDRLCLEEPMQKKCDTELELILPLILIFLSQFAFGIGNTLFFALGQTYLDDGVKKKKNTPILLGYTLALRTFGPVIGFVLGYACLKVYVDPTKTPLIDSSDPRWMGAYWLGWIVMGVALTIIGILIGLFPRHMQKKALNDTSKTDNSIHLQSTLNSNGFKEIQQIENDEEEQLTIGNLVETLIRLFKNKILMYNTISVISYIIAGSVYFTFLSKYLEVQFHKKAADATIISGPITLLGMVSGFLIAGIVITKKKPSTSKILMFDIVVGLMYVLGQISFLFLTCPDGKIPVVIENGRLNVSSACNTNCHCAGIPYTPVCLEETGDTFFNPCVASCKMYSKKKKMYYDCDCATYHLNEVPNEIYNDRSADDSEQFWTGKLTPGACIKGCAFGFYAFTLISCIVNSLGCASKVGNALISFRCVRVRDKSVTQGLILMMISMLALIPGPILYGRIIDETCIVWTEQCSDRKGNCELYDQKLFRYYINLTAIAFTSIGITFDFLVWKNARNMNLYVEDENANVEPNN